MALSVGLYTFSKKRNSTAVPAAAPVTFNCVLKTGCSIVNPHISIDNGSAWNPSSYNYANIMAFGRFYYVTDWVYDNGLWWASLTVDVLATYKTHILNNTAYVARASKIFDRRIADGLYPAKSAYDLYVDELTTANGRNPWAQNLSNGFYVVGIINDDVNSMGGISYYAFTPAQFAALKNFLMSSANWTGITLTNPDLGDSLYKSLFNPFQYISTINWFPFSFTAAWGTSLTDLQFGWWTLNNISCYRLTTFSTTFLIQFYTTPHPQEATRGEYMRGAPYTTYRLYIPPFGEFTLDASIMTESPFNATHGDITNAALIAAYVHVDLISGNGDLWVYSYNQLAQSIQTHVRTQSICCVPIQMAQITTDAWGMKKNNIETAANVLGSAFSLDIGGTISNLITGVISAAETQIPHLQETGNNGCLSTFQMPMRLETVYAIFVDDALSDKGRPLCQEIQLGDLYPGFVLVVGAHVEIPGAESEISEINTMLDEGVYLE